MTQQDWTLIKASNTVISITKEKANNPIAIKFVRNKQGGSDGTNTQPH